MKKLTKLLSLFLLIAVLLSCTQTSSPVTGGAEDGENPLPSKDGWIEATAETVVRIIKNVKDAESCKIRVTGPITDETIDAMNAVLNGEHDVGVSFIPASIELDLSQTTGLTALKERAFYDIFTLVGIKLPEGITSIGNSSFKNCSRLRHIYLPDSLTKIDEDAFRFCTELLEIKISKNVSELKENPFAGCKSLTSFVVNAENPYFSSSDDRKVLLNKDKTILLSFPSATNESDILESVTVIGAKAFSGCAMTNFTIPDGVTTIEYEAFSLCQDLTSLILPNTLTTLGKQVFSQCNKLTTLQLPPSLVTLEEKVFYFWGGLKNISIPDTVTSIGESAFAFCDNLSNIEIPNSVTEIGSWAFSYCENLLNIEIPNSVTEIGLGAFSDCKSLASVEIPESIIEIDSFTFENCTNLESITIPETVSKIGIYVFNGCTNLKEVIFEDTQGWKINSKTIDVTDSEENVTYFKETYVTDFWNKS